MACRARCCFTKPHGPAPEKGGRNKTVIVLEGVLGLSCVGRAGDAEAA